MRDGLKTVSHEEWENSPHAELLSSSPYGFSEDVEQPAEKIHSNFLNVKGKKNRIPDRVSRALTGTHS